MKPKSKILIIAGSDSSGGAGIQADIKTVTSLGSYALTSITSFKTMNATKGKRVYINVIQGNSELIDDIKKAKMLANKYQKYQTSPLSRIIFLIKNNTANGIIKKNI